MISSLDLIHESSRVGVVTITEAQVDFIYDPDWAGDRDSFHLSLSMPSPHPAEGAKVLSWLVNLLPEGDNLIGVGRALGVATGDVVALLTRLGGDTAGSVGVGRPRPFDPTPRFLPIENEESLRRILDELPAKPFLAGEDGVSMSLAGVQEKLPLALVDGQLAVPVDGAPSSHILKPDTPRLLGSVHNEALCMVLARLCGLSVAGVQTGRAEDRCYLLVERYDRQPDGRGWRRLHQEDFCQALGVGPAAKYEFNQSHQRGPTILDMLAVIDTHMTAVDRLALLDAVIFNVLICNTDAHAKNYSILLGRARSAKLAPLYDLTCADAWAGMTRLQAQAIGGERGGDQIRGKHWRRFAAEAGFSDSRLMRQVATLATKVTDRLDEAVREVEAMPAGGHAMLARFQESIARRCRRVIANLSID